MWKHLKLVDEGKHFMLDNRKINWRMTYFSWGKATKFAWFTDRSSPCLSGKSTSLTPDKNASTGNTAQVTVVMRLNFQIIKTKSALPRTLQQAIGKIKYLQMNYQLWKITITVVQATHQLVTVRHLGHNKWYRNHGRHPCPTSIS